MELLLEPRYRHGCYTVFLAGEYELMLRLRGANLGPNVNLATILQPWLTPVYYVLHQRDLL